MVQCLFFILYGEHGVIQLLLRRRILGITGIIKDCADAHFRRHESSLHAVCLRVTPTRCAFGGTKRCRYRKMD